MSRKPSPSTRPILPSMVVVHEARPHSDVQLAEQVNEVVLHYEAMVANTRNNTVVPYVVLAIGTLVEWPVLSRGDVHSVFSRHTSPYNRLSAAQLGRAPRCAPLVGTGEASPVA